MNQRIIHNNWEKKKLGELASFINGYSFQPSDWKSSGLPIIRIEQLKDLYAKCDYCDRNLPDKFIINNGDLLFSWSASLTLEIWNRGKAYLNQHLFKVITKDNINKLYLKYLIEYNLDKIKKETHGSTIKHITRPQLLNFSVIIPKNIIEQQKIASILQSVDNAIERTKKLINKYIKIKNGLMQDLFTKGIDENNQIRNENIYQFKNNEIKIYFNEWSVKKLHKGAVPELISSFRYPVGK